MKIERGVAFNGREGNQPPQKIQLSTDEWRAFTAACERVGVQATGMSYWQWRLREGPFSAAAR